MGFSFELISTMSKIRELKIEGIYYQHYPLDAVPLGYVVRDDEQGMALKVKLGHFIKQIDMQNLFSEYWWYINLPSNGIVPLEQPGTSR